MASKKKIQEKLPPAPQDALSPYPFVYDACCESCGIKLGETSFPVEKLDWNPKNAGLKCGACAQAELTHPESTMKGIL